MSNGYWANINIKQKRKSTKLDEIGLKVLSRKGLELVRTGTKAEDMYQGRDYLFKEYGWFDFKGTERDNDYWTVQNTHVQRFNREQWDKLPDFYFMYYHRRGKVTFRVIHVDEMMFAVQEHGTFVEKYQPTNKEGVLRPNHYWKVPKNVFTGNWLA